jgi:hypothetical protein
MQAQCLLQDIVFCVRLIPSFPSSLWLRRTSRVLRLSGIWRLRPFIPHSLLFACVFFDLRKVLADSMDARNGLDALASIRNFHGLLRVKLFYKIGHKVTG